jgi:hypothetical protein
MWNSAHSNLTLVHLPPSPLPCVNKYRGTRIHHTVCNKVGGGGPGAWTDKILPPRTFTGKSRHLGFRVFTDIWFMTMLWKGRGRSNSSFHAWSFPTSGRRMILNYMKEFLVYTFTKAYKSKNKCKVLFIKWFIFISDTLFQFIACDLSST